MRYTYNLLPSCPQSPGRKKQGTNELKKRDGRENATGTEEGEGKGGGEGGNQTGKKIMNKNSLRCHFLNGRLSESPGSLVYTLYVCLTSLLSSTDPAFDIVGGGGGACCWSGCGGFEDEAMGDEESKTSDDSFLTTGWDLRLGLRASAIRFVPFQWNATQKKKSEGRGVEGGYG
ncbi:hypothetical protein M407DRAFT_178192 [Tulasnella calospora MUT 4182]|uniref:Uncharacterized protein n=1 Tax=Tulasnella calospora MUT 4182 TaxID=1051891 RepID=A0A0C3QVX5_9AGAM|nr:hypothetical protein M407DRAFT_178192 [Tulasnella calospora MUT 4182]